VLFALLPNWKNLSDAALRGQLSTIIETAKTIDPDAPAVAATEDSAEVPSGLDQLEALADAKELIEAELEERDATAAAEQTRRDEVMGRFADDPDDDEDGEEDEEPADDPAEASTPADQELSTDPAADAPVADAADPAPAGDAPAAEAATGDAPAAATEPAEQPGDDGAAAPATASASAVTRAMSASRASDETPGAGGNASVERMMRTTSQLGSADVDPGTVVDLDRMAELLTERLHNLTGWQGNREMERAFRALWQFGDGEMLTQAPNENYPILRDAQRHYQEEQDVLVASGGPCAPLMPTYNFFQCFSPQRPLEAFLPTVGAPRGGIRFIDPPGLSTEAGAAIDTKDSTALATTPGAGWVDKNCSRVTCPTETEVTVAAVSWCVTFDNLNFRVFPEQVRDFLEQVQTMHTRAKEIYYLDRIDDLSTAAVDIATATAPAYGAVRSLYRELLTIGHNYRKRNNMSTDAVLDILLPDVVQEILAIDMTNDASVGMSVAAGPGGNLAEVLARKARLNIGWYYYDGTDGAFPSSEHNGVGTAWQDLPTVVRSYVYAPGSIVRLDAGTLDVGPVRDSALNRTNDVELFAEQWVEIANVGCEINAYDHTLCPDGTAPVGVTALAC
jgi:hypothetical protein